MQPSWLSFGRNQVINDQGRVSSRVAILSTILVIVHQKKHIFMLQTEFDRSNPYIKCGKNKFKRTKLLRVTTTVDGCKMIGGSHFVTHLGYRLSKKKHLQT